MICCKMRYVRASFVLIISTVVLTNAYIKIASLDEKWICRIKRSCVDCLQLDHCSWCPSSKKCFSEHISSFEHICNDTVKSKKYEMSLYENAKCACNVSSIEDNCRPAGITEGPECYGRGACVCGRCFCDTNPDNPSKVIIGEHCEFDNFSCDGPKCNEGPYYINDLQLNMESNINNISEIEQPEEK